MKELYSIPGFHDPMSSISHLAGTVFFFVFSILLLIGASRSTRNFLYALQFAIATLLALSMSFVFHMLPVGTAREVMLRLDVAAIFVLIASTFTVIHGILFTGWQRWGIILAMWVIAVLGLTLRTIFFHSIPSYLGDGIFLLMGWIGTLSAYLLWKEYRWRAVGWVLAGGLCYTLGALSNTLDWPIIIDRVWGPHETFHLMVLAGLGIHWAFILKIANGSFQRKFESDARPSI